MARLHGLAGQWAKTQAERRLNRSLLLFAASGVLGGFAMGYAFAGPSVARGIGLTAAGLAVLILALRLAQGHLRALTKQRIKFLRGGQVEGLVGWLLKELPDTWHVIHGIKLGPNWDVDHVVVGPGGLFCVSTKASRGMFGDRDGVYCCNNRPTDVLQDTTRQALVLRGRLTALLGGTVPYVHAVLAIPLAYVDGPSACRGVHVLHQDNLVDTLEGFAHKLDGATVSRCASALVGMVGDTPRSAVA
jgi:hypothetical protein